MSRPLALADLNDPREAAFVAAVLELGPAGAPEAALRAGYAADYAQAERAAAFLMGAERIRRCITTEIKSRFDALAADAQNALAEIVRDRKAPASARISAAESILSRSSIGPIPSRSMAVHVDGNAAIEEIIRRLDAGEHAEVIDGKAVGVTDVAQDDAEGAAE